MLKDIYSKNSNRNFNCHFLQTRRRSLPFVRRLSSVPQAVVHTPPPRRPCSRKRNYPLPENAASPPVLTVGASSGTIRLILLERHDHGGGTSPGPGWPVYSGQEFRNRCLRQGTVAKFAAECSVDTLRPRTSTSTKSILNLSIMTSRTSEYATLGSAVVLVPITRRFERLLRSLIVCLTLSCIFILVFSFDLPCTVSDLVASVILYRSS